MKTTETRTTTTLGDTKSSIWWDSGEIPGQVWEAALYWWPWDFVEAEATSTTMMPHPTLALSITRHLLVQRQGVAH